MNILESVLLVLHLGVAVAICGFVLLQHGKGADMGAAFGSGASGSLFGASGSANFLSHTTAVLAAVFFVTSIGLTWYATSKTGGLMERSVLDKAAPAASPGTPDVPPAPAAAGGSSAPASGATPAQPSGGSAAQPPGSKAGEVPK